jgi:Ca2+-binding EF-hand superfamily protein
MKGLNPDQIAQARQAFDKFDTDKDGYIDKDEFRNFFRKIKDLFDPSGSKEEFEKVLSEQYAKFDNYETDKDGKINFDEFFNFSF